MAGRGRGSGTSLTQEQLQRLGNIRTENTPQTLAPPPLFPKLEAKALPLNNDAATDYMLIVKDQFIQYFNESPAYVRAEIEDDDIERYSDKYKLLAREKQRKPLDCVWTNMPVELRPQAYRTRASRKKKINEPEDIAKRLRTLEKKESQEISESMETNEEENPTKKEDDEDEEELEDEQEQDYELDDGTDYANNYFDNGEDYGEDDDTLDDGPVY